MDAYDKKRTKRRCGGYRVKVGPDGHISRLDGVVEAALSEGGFTTERVASPGWHAMGAAGVGCVFIPGRAADADATKIGSAREFAGQFCDLILK